MKTKLFLFLTLAALLGLNFSQASAQKAPASGTITLGTELKVGDNMNLIFTGPDGSSKDITVKGAKPVIVEGKIAYEITQKPVQVIGPIVTFECTMSRITTLEFKNCSLLKELICGTNVIKYLDLTGLSSLVSLNCTSADINTIKLDGCENLKSIKADANKLRSINLAAAPKLESVSLPVNSLTEINLDGVACTSLDLSSNSISSLDLSKTKNLQWLSVSTNPLTSINLKGCTSLETFSAKTTNLTEIDLSDLKALENVDLHGGALTKITLKGNENMVELDLSKNKLSTVDLTGATNLKYLHLNNNDFSEMKLKGLSMLGEINLRYNKLTNFSVEDCPELKKLVLSDNQLTSADLTGGKESLKEVYLDGNKLSSLDLAGFASLSSLVAARNQLTSVKLDGCTSLYSLDLSSNKFSEISLSGLKSLGEVYVHENDLHGDAMLNLMKSLPKKQTFTSSGLRESFAGSIYAIETRSDKEHNICLESDVKVAHEQGWGVYDHRTWSNYEGAKQCKVTTKTVGKGGSIKVNSQAMLENVYSDIRVSITAESEEGYALKSLVVVAKGDSIDIFKDRYFYLLHEETEVVATFTNDVCKVVLKKLGQGTLKLKGDGLDTKGLPRGMEIEVVAGTPDSSEWELSTLMTRNLKTGQKKNILSSKTFILTDDMEVFAEFSSSTGANPGDTLTWDGSKWLGVIMPIVPGSPEAQLYPNPAMDFVTISGAQPAATVGLYTLTGVLIRHYAINREGYAELSVADLPEGTYIVLIGTDPRKLIIRH